MPASLPLVDASTPLCCGSLGTADLDMQRDPEAIAARLRALADANRIRIVQELACCEGHALSTRDVGHVLGVSESTANHHLKQLERAGIVTPRRDGARVLYELNVVAARAIAATLNVTCGLDSSCC